MPANTDDGRSVIRHSAAHVLAQAVQDMIPEAKLGIGPPITDGFYYDFDVPRAFTPEDLEALEKRMRQIVKEGQLFSRRVYESKDEAREELANEPYKLELVDDKSGDPEVMEVGGDELTAYDNLNPRTRRTGMGRSVPRPAHPDDAIHPGVQADPQLGGVLARRPEQRQPATHLRHRMGVAGGARQAPRADRGGRAPRSPQARRRAGPILFPDEIGSGLVVFHPKGGIVRRELEDYSRRKHIEAGYEFVNTPHITKAQLFHIFGTPGLVRRRHVPADACRRRVRRGRHGAQARPGLLPEADELPDALPDLPVARAVVSRTSVAALRVRHRLPVRELGRGARADQGARIHDGRLAHLLHARADARRAVVIAAVRARSARRLRARGFLPGAVDKGSRTSSSAPTRCGRKPPARWPRLPRRRASSWCPTRAARRSTARRSRCRPGRTGPQLADVDDPAGLQLPGALRAGVHRRRRQQAAAGDDPPRAVRVDRAVLRHPHRALRRRVPRMAGARAGGRHPGRRRSHPVPQRPCRTTEDARHPGRGGRQRRPDGQEDRQPHQSEGAVHVGGRRP